jgi:O-methyltransferase
MVFRIFLIVTKIRPLERIYWQFFHGFKPTSSCTPETLTRIFNHADKMGILKNRDYYEFGVFKGYSIWFAQKTASGFTESKNMQFFGFDSFAGLPKPVGSDKNGYFYEGQYNCGLDTVMKNLVEHEADLSRIKLIPGFYEKSLKPEIITKYRMRKAAIINIDCDLYSSTRDALKFIKPLLAPGTIILFDDYYAFSRNEKIGEPKAFHEFETDNPKLKIEKLFPYCWHGMAFKVVSLS